MPPRRTLKPRSNAKRVVTPRARSWRPASSAGRFLTALHVVVDSPPVERPSGPGACADNERPCPWVSCKWHLYLDINPRTGSIKLNFPDVAPDDIDTLEETCAMRRIRNGASTLEDIGAVMNLTRERVRQIQDQATARIKAARRLNAFEDG